MSKKSSKINALTQDQIDALPAWRDEYLRHGLSTEPIDREKAKRAVTLAYKCAGLDRPRIWIWLRSPLAGVVGATFLTQVRDQVWDQVRAQVGDQVGAQVRAQVRDQVGAQVRAQVWDQVRAQVWAQVWDQVRDQVWDQVRAQVGDQVWAQVWDEVRDQVWDQVRAQVGDQVVAQVGAQVRAQVWDQVGDQVGAQVWAQVWDQVGDQVRAHMFRTCYGLHDAGWISFYSFFSRYFQIGNAIEGLSACAKTIGWWWPFDNACVITERPIKLQRDDQNRLHAEDGPAASYSDGFSVHCWHGVRVPASWIGPNSSLTPAAALAEPNLERRRAACEIIGWHKILQNLGAQTIDKDEDPQIGELVEVDIPDVGRERFLRVQCATGREFALPVPPEMQSALQANAWTYGIEDFTNYKPEVRT